MRTAKLKTAAWFIREIQKQYAADPAKPIRLDVVEDEAAEWCEAFRMAMESIGPFRSFRCESPTVEGATRVALLGPDGAPKPVETVKGARLVKGTTPANCMEQAGMMLARLRKKYAPGFHVEPVVVMGRRTADDGFDFLIWRGEDWLSLRTAMLTPLEIVRELDRGESSKYLVATLELDADKWRSMVRQTKSNQPKATEASIKKTAHCSWDDIVADFIAYKGTLYSAAELNISRKRGYAIASKLGDRIRRKTGMTPAKWFAVLKKTSPHPGRMG